MLPEIYYSCYPWSKPECRITQKKMCRSELENARTKESYMLCSTTRKTTLRLCVTLYEKYLSPNIEATNPN